MSSAGQIIGGIAGAVIGAFIPGGYILLGASIGMAVGGAIDPPKGPKIEGPRLSDLSVQGVGYGAPIPRVYGTVATMGTIFWVENNQLKETKTTEDQGGKGGSSQEVTSYSYSATFALALCQGPIDSVRRIWISGKLIYDASAQSVGGIVASSAAAANFTLYTGTAAQLASPRMQATLGAANVPAYRGLAYLVFEDLQLADYGNSLMGAQIKVEIVTASTFAYQSELVGPLIDPSIAWSNKIGSVRFDGDKLRVSGLTYDSEELDLKTVTFQQHQVSSSVFTWGSEASVPDFHDTSVFFAKTFPKIVQSDTDVNLIALSQNPTVHIIGYAPGGVKIMDSGPFSPSDLPYIPGNAVIDRGEIFFAYSYTDRKIYKLPFEVWGEMPENNAGLSAPIISTVGGHDIEQFGVSENYLYAIDRAAATTSSCSVLKFDRVTLDYVETFTQAVRGTEAKISVVGDDDFYTLGTTGVLSRWIDGVATDTGLRYTQATTRFNESWFVRFSDNLFYVVRPVNTGEQSSPADLFVFSSYRTPTCTVLSDIVEAECLLSKMLTAGDIDVSALTSDVCGYKLTQTAALRAGIDPLQASWPFDVVESGYLINFIPRGASSVATIDISELGAVAGNESKAVQITNSREMDLQIPRRVEVIHLDSEREYDSGEQASERINTDAVNILRVELPIVMTADEAAQKSEVLLYLYWLERNDLSFTLPPPYGNLEPADVITINADDASYQVRLTSISLLQDGRLECAGKFNSTAVYSSSALGESGLVPEQDLTWPGLSDAVLMDVPALLDSMDTPGFLAVVYGQSPSWYGGVLMQTGDSGATWTSAYGFINTAPMVGMMATDSGPVRPDIINSRAIVVRLTTGTLASVTALQLLGGANHFAYGIDGRWEIIGAQTCTDLGDGDWLLTDIISGRFGTEWATSLHVISDFIVKLDTTSAGFIGQNQATIGIERIYRAVTNGMPLDSASDLPFTYNGVNLECLSPVYVRGARAASNDWSVDWVRRTRIGGEWRDRIDAPLSETSEGYEVEIYSDSTYATLKRTITGLATPAATYASAQQTTDFGSAQSTLYLKIYQLSSVVGRGFPATVTLTASAATAAPPYMQSVTSDPHWANVVLAMHMDGTNGGTAFTDVKGHTMTRYAVTTTTAEYKYGTASADFPGNVGYYLTTPAVSDFLLGSGNFTVDFWVKAKSATAGKVVGIWSDTSGVGFSWKARISDDMIGFAYSTTGGDSTFFTTTGLSLGTTNWHFVEISRSGSDLYFFLDGVKVATHNIGSATLYAVASSKLLEVGRDSAGPGEYIDAYIDELRVTKGVCRHSTDYTPPPNPFPETA